MATSVRIELCNVCEVRNKTCQAIKWCPECEEKLCEDCYGNHTASKLSRNHEVIDLEQYRKLPQYVLAVKNICDEYDKKFSNFCQQHDKICCPVCISKTGAHSKCTTVVLDEVIKTAKTSVLLQSVEGTLKNLKLNLQTILTDRQSNLQNLHDQKDTILKEVKKMKKKIVDHLTDFEKQLSYDLEKSIMKNSHILKSEVAILEEKMRQAETMSNESNIMKQYGSDLQIFIGSRSINQDVNMLNNNFRELVGNMKQVGVTLQWNSKVNKIIEKLPSLGCMLEEETPMAVTLSSDLGMQVQVMPSPLRMSINDINITLKSVFQINDKIKNVRGCSIFQNNKAICAESENRNLIVFKKSGKKEKTIAVSSCPWDVTIIDDNKVAVSTDEGVKVINITTNAVEKTINTGKCHGLEYYKGFLFCCAPGKGVLSVDLSSSSSSTVVQDKTSDGWFYCAVNNDRIYTTRSGNHTVTCYTMGGDKVWEYSDKSVLDFPVGITVGKSSNVYILAYYNNSIVVLSPEGKRHYRRLLTKRDGIVNPWALHFDRSRNQLLVGNMFGPLLMFSIESLIPETNKKTMYDKS